MAEVRYDFAPPWPSSSPEQGRAHTQILISAAVQRVHDRGARSTVIKNFFFFNCIYFYFNLPTSRRYIYHEQMVLIKYAVLTTNFMHQFYHYYTGVIM